MLEIVVVSFSVLSRANFEDGWTSIYRIKTLNHDPLPTSSSFFLSLSHHLLLSLYSKSQGEKEKKEAKNIATRIKINNKEA